MKKISELSDEYRIRQLYKNVGYGQRVVYILEDCVEGLSSKKPIHGWYLGATYLPSDAPSHYFVYEKIEELPKTIPSMLPRTRGVAKRR